MTELQLKFVQLCNQKERMVKQLKEINEYMEMVMQEIGLNTSFQDSEGIVYKITEPSGQYVAFKKIDYVRTKREGEAKGSLSKKEAKAMGFDVEEKE